MVRDAGHSGVLDEIDRIRAAGVFGDARVGEINVTILVEHHVLEHGAEAQRLKDIRFAFGGQVDRFRIAAALDIEDAVVAPAVLVIADQVPFRIGGAGR